VVLKLRTKKESSKKYKDEQHTTQKNDLSRLGLDPRIVVETREK
jgi:hypothetical protein